MKKVVKTKGGYRIQKRAATGQKLVLRYVFSMLGGATRVAELLGKIDTGKEITPQQIVNWRLRGRVPIDILGEVARALRVDRYALNYEQSASFFGSAPHWKDVVDELPIPAELKRRILLLPKPKELYVKKISSASDNGIDATFVRGTAPNPEL